MTSKLLEDRRVKLVPRADPEHTWSGYVRYQRCKDYITSYLDKGGILVTGLTSAEEKEYEQLMRMEEGKLSKYSDYWNEYAVIMYDKEKELDLSKVEDSLAFRFLKAHKNVSNSWDELSDWPYASYIITDDINDAKTENTNNDIEIKATTLFTKLSIDQMSNILKLYLGNINNNNVAPDVVKSKLYKAMKDDPEKFIELVEDKALETKLMISQLVALKILRKNRNAYYYGEDVLGHDLEDTVGHIDNPENQGLKIALKQELTKKNKK